MADFKYVELITPSKGLLDTIKTMMTFASYPLQTGETGTPPTNTWEFISEQSDATTGQLKELVLGATTSINSVTKVFHLRITHNGLGGVGTNHSTLTFQLMDGYTEGEEPTYENEGHPVVCEFADEVQVTDRGITSPVYINATITNNSLAMVLMGDPAVNFNDYRKSFVYVGALKPFEYNMDDVDGNVVLTAGAVTDEPSSPVTGYSFGQYTSYGNNTLQMLKTKSGILFQRHYASFITQVPTVGKAYTNSDLGDTGLLLEPSGFNASLWTRRYHLSPVYIFHPYEGYRGQLDRLISVAKHNILHRDELVVDVTGKDWTQEVYVYFDHNTEQQLFNRSANVRMGVALLKEYRGYAS